MVSFASIVRRGFNDVGAAVETAGGGPVRRDRYLIFPYAYGDGTPSGRVLKRRCSPKVLVRMFANLRFDQAVEPPASASWSPVG